jgi:hypothetical protein
VNFSDGCADPNATLSPTYIGIALQSIESKVKVMYGFIWGVMAIFFFEVIVGSIGLSCKRCDTS